MLDKIRTITHELTALPLSDIQVSERKRLDYQSNNLYDIHFADTHWITKEFVKENERAYSPKREYDALNLLVPLDLAPKPIHFLPFPDEPQPIVIYEFMAGQMWNRTAPSIDDLKNLAQIWLITHQATQDNLWLSRGWDLDLSDKLARHHKFYEHYFTWAEAHYPQGIAPAKRVYTLYDKYTDILDQLATAKPSLLFSRSDPRFANIIQRPDGRIGFVDWEDSGLRDPARTIADLMIHPNQEDLVSYDQWQIFLEIYCDSYPIEDKSLRQRIEWYKILMSLTWFGGLLFAGVRRANNGENLSDWHINGLPANQRLRRYLARALTLDHPEQFEAQLTELSDISFFPQA